jgi:hypothetical protein
MKIISWRLMATNDEGDEINVSDCPDYVASAVDEYMTELKDYPFK